MGTETRKEVQADGQEKALQELLKILCDDPEVAERITITIRPDKLEQGKAEDEDPEAESEAT